jgi:hypothetical protein
MIIDYESKYTYPLTNDSLTQICGVNTMFGTVSCSYGIFPSANVSKSIDNAHITDWVYHEFATANSSIMNLFK